MFPFHCANIYFNRIVTFHANGKAEIIVPSNEFRISHVTEKCLCVMFNFHPRIVHVYKDDAYDANNNVFRSIYQVIVIGNLDLEWRVNFERFMIIVKNLLRSFHNIILVPKTMASLPKMRNPMLSMLFYILGKSSRRFSSNVSISIFVHRFVRFFQWRWNAYNLFLPIKIFSASELFSFCLCWFPIWEDHLCRMLLTVSKQCPLLRMPSPS